MPMTDPAQLIDRVVVDEKGQRIGVVVEAYVASASASASVGEPEPAGWLAVATGALGGHVAPVPLVLVSTGNGELVAHLAKDVVTSAPHHDPQMALSREEEAALFDHYEIGPAERARLSVTGAGGHVPTTDDYTTEDAERAAGGAGLVSGAAQSGVAARADEAREAEHAGTGDVTEPPIYPDDATEAELERDRELRARTARHRADDNRP